MPRSFYKWLQIGFRVESKGGSSVHQSAKTLGKSAIFDGCQRV
jgi:hypothetical protein